MEVLLAAGLYLLLTVWMHVMAALILNLYSACPHTRITTSRLYASVHQSSYSQITAIPVQCHM